MFYFFSENINIKHTSILYMSCIGKTACFPVNYALHSLQPGRNEEP